MATNLTTDNIYEVADSGLVARTGVGTAAGRTITGTSNEIAVANGSGAAGNPTLSLPSTIVLTGKTITGLAAASVVNTPAGSIAATTVQAAINELDTEKLALADALRPWTVKTTTYTAVSGDRILANTTSGAWTLTLPASPADGAQVWVQDYDDTFATNNLTIARNGSTILDLSENLVANINSAQLHLVYRGGTWRY